MRWEHNPIADQLEFEAWLIRDMVSEAVEARGELVLMVTVSENFPAGILLDFCTVDVFDLIADAEWLERAALELRIQ